MPRVWTALTLTLAFIGCGSGADQSSPQGVSESLSRAMDRRDPELGLQLIAPADKLREAFDCGAADTLAAATERAREELRISYEELGATGVAVRLGHFDQQGSETMRLTMGDAFRGCTAKAAVEIVRARLTLVYRKGARDDEDPERWDFIRFAADGPWWFVPR